MILMLLQIDFQCFLLKWGTKEKMLVFLISVSVQIISIKKDKKHRFP